MSIVNRITLIATLAVAGTSAVAQAQKKLPMPVQRELAEMMKMCKEAGGKALPSPGLLTVADLTGDGRPDFVIDQAAFNCEGAASLFAGSGGSQVSAYVGTPDGQARQAFSGGTFGVKVDPSARPASLQIIVGGPLCGQKVSARTPHSAYRSCWRPVLWNEGAQKFDYAPLSQIRPIQ